MGAAVAADWIGKSLKFVPMGEVLKQDRSAVRRNRPRGGSGTRGGADGVWSATGRVVFGVLLLFCGCRSAPPSQPLHRYEFRHPAMGTLFTITVYAPDGAAASAAADAAFHRVDELEDIMSDYQADSELMRLCDEPAGKPVKLSMELFDILKRSQRISELSHGAFDVTVGPYVRLWRFARKRKVLPEAAELEAAAAASGYKKLRLDRRTRTATLLAPHMRLDLGGIAKGYAADQALKVLKGRGISRALVAASGDIAIGDPPPGEAGWKIGISGLGASNSLQRTLLLRNAGVSTSGDAEQFIQIGGKRYSHLLDPATGLGLTNRIQATVVAPNATTTDAVATAICILGPGRGLALADHLPGGAALVLTRDDGHVSVFTSRRFDRLPSPALNSGANGRNR